jgi:hypothetical protein
MYSLCRPFILWKGREVQEDPLNDPGLQSSILLNVRQVNKGFLG